MKTILTKKTKQFMDSFPDKTTLAEQLGLDLSFLTRVLKGERTITNKFVNAFLIYSGWSFEDAFEIQEEAK